MVSFFTVVVYSLAVYVFVIFFQKFKLWLKYRNIMNCVQGPPYICLFGNCLEFSGNAKKPFTFLRNCAKTFKYSTYRFWSGPVPVVNLLDPDDIEQLLSSIKHIEKSLVYYPLLPWLNTGLLTSTGAKWQNRRKILTPAFHFNILQEFLPILVEEGERLIKEIKLKNSINGTDVVPLVRRTALNAICETAMGTVLDNDSKEMKEYHRAINRLGNIVLLRLTKIWYYIDAIFKYSSYKFEHDGLIKTLHAFSKNVIEGRQKIFETNNLKTYIDAMQKDSAEDLTEKPKKRLAMLDLLLKAKSQGANINDDGIREEVDTFMFAGHDTTAAALGFILLNISNHSDVQKTICQELYEVFGTSDRAPNYNDLSQLSYLDRCIKESLRLYPSVPLISRMIKDPFTTKAGNDIPKNIMAHVHIFDLHRNPEIYPNPEKYDPDRFLPENTRTRHPYAYIPFSAGPRNCIGQRFALLELKTVISYILRNFSLEPVDTPETINLVQDLVLRVTDGIRVKFVERQLSNTM